MVNGFVGDVLNDPLLALSIIRTNIDKYHSVICDIRMPGKSGIELAEEIKKISPYIRIILMSSNDNDYLSSTENENNNIVSFRKNQKIFKILLL
jgi:CheY-like chemotaxis protein